MIKPLLKDQFFLDNVFEASEDHAGFHLWWLGQSGYLIQWQGNHLLIDPYLSDSLTVKYAQTDKQHIRMTELIVDPSRLNFIDVVTSSHNHTDHLDAQTLNPLIKANPGLEMICPRANLDFVSKRLGCEFNWPIPLNASESVSLTSGFKVHGIPAAHNELKLDKDGNCHFMGFVFQFGPYTVYHSGDTLWREEIIEALAPFQIDIALLPINGNIPERRVAGNLNAREAISLGIAVNAQVVIPCHYHMFTFNTVEPYEFVQIAKDENQQIKVLKCGESFSYK